MNTEVLWGGGLWWGLLRTSAPTAHHVQQVLDVDDTLAIMVPDPHHSVYLQCGARIYVQANHHRLFVRDVGLRQ